MASSGPLKSLQICKQLHETSGPEIVRLVACTRTCLTDHLQVSELSISLAAGRCRFNRRKQDC